MSQFAASVTYLLTLGVRDALSREELLLTDWQRLTQPLPTAVLGHEWLGAGRSLALRVPSVMVAQEHSLPAHPEFAQVRLAAEPFHFDGRPRT